MNKITYKINQNMKRKILINKQITKIEIIIIIMSTKKIVENIKRKSNQFINQTNIEMNNINQKKIINNQIITKIIIKNTMIR